MGVRRYAPIDVERFVRGRSLAEVVESDPLGVGGWLRFYEREVGSRRWRLAGEARNIVLNGFYNDLFSVMGGTAVTLAINALALGYQSGTITPARTDTGLAVEWANPVTTLTTALTNGQTGITALAVAATPEPIPSGTSIQLGTGQTVTTSASTAAGATSIPVTSFTASQAYGIGTGLNVTSWTPQRVGITLVTPTTTDPPQSVFSFYLPAAANLVTIVFTEAGLLYNNSSVTPNGAPSRFATHAAFSYTKAPNTDLRIDYTLARSLT